MTISTAKLRERAQTQENNSGDVHGVSVRPSELLALVEAVEASIDVKKLVEVQSMDWDRIVLAFTRERMALARFRG